MPRKAKSEPIAEAAEASTPVSDPMGEVVPKKPRSRAKKAAATRPPATGTPAIDDSTAATESRMMDVVFQLQPHGDAREVVLVGDFNGWSQAAHPMTRVGNVFEITVPLEKDHRYVYRYLIDGHHWENDWNADEYVPNQYGGDDSVRYT